MTSQTSLSWAMRPDPDFGTRIVAIWSVGDGARPADALEIDLLGRARPFCDRVKRDWIPISDDAPDIPSDWDGKRAPNRDGVYDLLDAINRTAG